MMLQKWILLILMPGFLCAQTTAKLQETTKVFYDAVYNIDIDKISEMLCTAQPDAYETLDNTFQNEDFKYRFVFTNAKFEIAKPFEADGRTYSKITFRNTVRLTSYKPLSPTEISEHQLKLKSRFNAQTLTYEKQRNSFFIVYTAKLAAIADTDGSWKFILLDNTLPKELTQGCLPEKIKNQLQ